VTLVDHASGNSGASVEQHRELRDAREQSAASREILAALGRDVANPGAVLDTVVENATRLCGAHAAQLFLLDGEVLRLSRVSGSTPEDYRSAWQVLVTDRVLAATEHMSVSEMVGDVQPKGFSRSVLARSTSAAYSPLTLPTRRASPSRRW
jgi:hypothetical protein